MRGLTTGSAVFASLLLVVGIFLNHAILAISAAILLGSILICLTIQNVGNQRRL